MSRSRLVGPHASGREALHNARELVAPVEQRLNEAVPAEGALALTELLTRVIEAATSS